MLQVTDPYSRPEWKRFYEYVTTRDGCCRTCGRIKGSDVVLQVHHTQYLPSSLPWESPPEHCITLCKYCHAAEHGLVRPPNGWVLGHVQELDSHTGVCDLGHHNLRFLYIVWHPKWPASLTIGEECCEMLTSLPVTRRKDFIESQKWKIHPEMTWRVHAKFDIVVRHVCDGFQIEIDGVLGGMRFGSEREAKGRVFDILVSGRLVAWFKKQFPEMAHIYD